MKRFVTKLPWLIAFAALVALVAYGLWPKPVPVELVKVIRGSLDVTVNDDGETRIREKYIISAPLAASYCESNFTREMSLNRERRNWL